MIRALPQCPNNWQVFTDAEQLAQQVVKQITQTAADAIASRGRFNLVTAGGRTPNRVYELLAESQQDWSHWHIYMGDERFAPLNDVARNLTPLTEKWLNKVTIPKENGHFMLTEQSADQALREYSAQVSDLVFDLTLLGMGEDGHTASLFPNLDWFDLPGDVALVTDAPKPPSMRLTLSLHALNRSRQVMKLVTGEEKNPAVQAWLAGKRLPIAAPQGIDTTWVYLDESAWLGH